jgi:hypothetical protein
MNYKITATVIRNNGPPCSWQRFANKKMSEEVAKNFSQRHGLDRIKKRLKTML